METRILLGISLLRSGLYTLESLLLPIADWIGSGRLPRPPNFRLLLAARKSMIELFRRDAERVAHGVYPKSVLLPGPDEQPLRHLRRLPLLVKEAVELSRRRKAKVTKSFGKNAKRHVAKAPEYYRRNFHFQKDGYLSSESAELYEHQVELLFAGAAGAMRRMALAPLKEKFDDRPFKLLELGCGTGSATRFLRLAFPKAKIVSVDLSAPYLNAARTQVEGVEFVQAAAEKLPFGKGSFDAVVSVFLFHELPEAVRREVVAESKRVLKKGGMFVFVDSLQLGDVEELDEPLRLFPVEFHEPFYPNYVRHPMGALLKDAGLKNLGTEIGFFSKCGWAKA